MRQFSVAPLCRSSTSGEWRFPFLPPKEIRQTLTKDPGGGAEVAKGGADWAGLERAGAVRDADRVGMSRRARAVAGESQTAFAEFREPKGLPEKVRHCWTNSLNPGLTAGGVRPAQSR